MCVMLMMRIATIMQVTRDTWQFTRHTSPVTRHTSHVTRHLCAAAATVHTTAGICSGGGGGNAMQGILGTKRRNFSVCNLTYMQENTAQVWRAERRQRERGR